MDSNGSHAAEMAMREEKAPTPETVEELAEYVRGLVERDHDYGTCVYAMSLAATAAFNHVAHKLGVTGFQASCADLDVLRRTRRMDGPFMVVDGANVVYPQYDLVGRVEDAVEEWRRTYGRDKAIELLAEKDRNHVSPNVVAHWEALAALPAADGPRNFR